MELANTGDQMLKGVRGGFKRGNTTLAVIATNARLTKVEAGKLAQMASLGMARTVYPANTMFDGDTVFALATGVVEADINAVGIAAAEALAASIVRAVRLAPTLGGVPGLAGPLA
jgi:L-aminopeptidase/D-esterase-like protein